MLLESATRGVKDYKSLINLLASEPLYWDVDSSVGREEMSFEWSADELRLSQSDANRLDGNINCELGAKARKHA
jgi:hypothetical protein